MPEYLFKDRHLGLSEEGVHLLRNGFNYSIIPWMEITSAEIARGNVLKNKPLLMTIGFGLVGLSIYLIVKLVINYLNPKGIVFYVEGILVPLFPLLIGAYAIYAVMKKEEVLILKGQKTRSFSLKSFVKEGKLEAMVSFLRKKGLLN